MDQATDEESAYPVVADRAGPCLQHCLCGDPAQPNARLARSDRPVCDRESGIRLDRSITNRSSGASARYQTGIGRLGVVSGDVSARCKNTAPYLPAKWAQLSDQQHGRFGQLLFQTSDSIQTHSVENAPLAAASARYPVLIFEPGLGEFPTQYTTLLEELASHGYAIFAITPTYSSDVVVFPDGRVAEATAAGNPSDASDVRAAGDRLVTVWAQDVIFVMNQLDRLNATPGTIWSQRLDLTRLGVFGHSFGGATAAQVCQMDSRCKAGIDLDGALFGPVMQTGLDKPFMVIESGQCSTPSTSGCPSFESGVQDVLRTVPSSERYHLSIKGTQHFNFSDYAVIFSPARALGDLGSIDGVRGLQITRAYVLAFFDTFLNHLSSPLLQGPASSYPEVQFLTP